MAILGGGMAGLTAAWALSGPETQREFDVCVYESEPHLGGKGASTRGLNGRIEEHGLHVWLGYYENAFRLMREVYGELDRPDRDPNCPIATWRDAFAPSDLVGVGDEHDGTWSHWVATFHRNRGEPGDAGGNGSVPVMVNFVERGLRLLLDFWSSVNDHAAASDSGGIVLSGSPEPPRATSTPQMDMPQVLRGSEIAAIIGALETIRALRAGIPGGGSLAGPLLGYLEQLRGELLARVDRSADTRRATGLADMVVSALIGIVRDGVLSDTSGFAAIDDIDFREWLARQGARPETLESPLIQGMYDLVFAYVDGDRDRPRFPAGLGLFLAGKLFFEYRGSIFWQMQAGMGDVVFAPLYQALRDRGVQFRFSHRIQKLHLSPDRSRIDTVEVAYDPAMGSAELGRVKGLPCFVSARRPDPASTRADGMVLKAGVDFDDVVLATSLAPIRSLGAELLADSAHWRALLDGVATVPTQSLQLWLREDEGELGWQHPGATVSGYATPFDTYASMSHVIPREAWPSKDEPRTLGYFCSVLEREAAHDHGNAHRRVRGNALHFLQHEVGHLWPGAVTRSEGFRWQLLCGADGSEGPARLDSQYWRANVEPAMQYVQALPGTGRLRLRADRSGYENLFLAGDWIDCGLNAGCIEAAVLAGLQAANAICGRPLGHGIVGSWMGLETR